MAREPFDDKTLSRIVVKIGALKELVEVADAIVVHSNRWGEVATAGARSAVQALVEDLNQELGVEADTVGGKPRSGAA